VAEAFPPEGAYGISLSFPRLFPAPGQVPTLNTCKSNEGPELASVSLVADG